MATYSFTGTIKDGTTDAGTMTGTITVTDPVIEPPPTNEGVPVVTPANASLPADVGLDVQIATVVATNSPTSYAIVSGNESGCFAVYSSGNLRTSHTVAMVTGKTYTLGVTASNAAGASAPASFVITVAAAVVDPPPIGGSGDYNNLTAIPTLDNRPSLSGTTLTWYGPDAGGASTATDKKQTRTLTASGSVNSSSNGQIIEGKLIDGTVTFNHPNVTVRRCAIRASGADIAVNMKSSATNAILEDCLVIADKTTSQPSFNAISGGSLSDGLLSEGGTVRRCVIRGADNLMSSKFQNFTIIDNYFYYPNSQSADGHVDLIEVYSQTKGTLLIKHNAFNCGEIGRGDWACGVNMWSGWGNLVDTKLENNYFIGYVNNPAWQKQITLTDTRSGGTIKMSFLNNGLKLGGFNGGAGSGITKNPNSGNFTMDTDSSLSGQPVNGNGKL